MTINITVYTTTTCPYCKMLKAYFDEEGVSYEEKLVDQDEEAKQAMLDVSNGFLGVPFTVIEKDGETKTIVGFDKGKFSEVLGK